ncbi:hypothetical protein FRC08_012861 [Ceratobasidium sp. 394]|nr:hypothetical protein FRC08_012861 [Ceratobasidium sp. 394]
MPPNNKQTTSPTKASPLIPIKDEPRDPPLLSPRPTLGPSFTTAPIIQARVLAVKTEPALPPLPADKIKSRNSAPPCFPTTGKADNQPNNDERVLGHETDQAPNPVDELAYNPANVLAKAHQIANTIGSHLQQLDLGTALRKDVWLREVESLKNQTLPQTMIAICGATGAGKSSLLNAVLDDNIVPTSGMRACTAVVAEIRYHSKPTITAKIEFLTLAEWKAELVVLLDDLVDKDGKIKRLSDLRSDAGVAWHKVHAVYPLLTPEELVKMTPDEIIATHLDTQHILDSTCEVESANLEVFALEIAQYIDSKDQKRNKGKAKESLKADIPALWPLVRLVRMCCNAEALSCGAVLVDLPGVADANLARSNIAKKYMKKCDRIWIVAPITRAVDDKTAKDLLGEAFRTQLMMGMLGDGNYDDRMISFIATKTDDVSCVEMIQSLGLYDDPELAEIENALDEARSGENEWEVTLECARKEVRGTDCEIDVLRSTLCGYEEQLTASKTSKPEIFSANHKKRKYGGGSREPKRQCSRGNEVMVMDDQKSDLSVEDIIVISSDSNRAVILSDSDVSTDKGESASGVGSSQQSLKEMVKKKQAELNALHELCIIQQKACQDAATKLAEHKKLLSMLQKEKNAFCATKRNEVRAF